MSQLLNKFFSFLNEENILYCVIHSFENLPATVASDIDICIDLCEQGMDRAVSEVCLRNKASIVQKYEYDVPLNFTYKILTEEGEFLSLDLSNDRRGGLNEDVLKTEEILRDRYMFSGFYVARPEIEAVYLLNKKSQKGIISDHDLARLRLLYETKRDETEKEIISLFGKSSLFIFRELLDEVKSEKRIELLNRLKGQRILKQVVLSPHRWPFIVCYEIKRVSRRVFYPVGTFAAIVAPDGAGKSSVSKGIVESLGPIFNNKIKVLHWRPGLLPKAGSLVFKDYVSYKKGTKSNRFISGLKWIYYLLDFFLGYYLKIVPLKIKMNLIIVERYYYDMVVSCERYGINLPKWLLKSVLPLIPRPELTIYLDNEPEVLFKRKAEFNIDILRKQVDLWRKFVLTLPNPKVIYTNRPLREVVQDVSLLILRNRIDFAKKILKVTPDGARYLINTEMAGGYVALPSKDNCRWILPRRHFLAERSWILYNMFSFKNRLFKETLAFLSRAGALYLFRPLDLKTKDENISLRKILEDLFKRKNIVLAVSTGSKAASRKTTAMIMSADKAEIIGYAKIGESNLAIERINHEAQVLDKIKKDGLFPEKNISIPDILSLGKVGDAALLVQSPAPKGGVFGPGGFNEDYETVISSLIKNTSKNERFEESGFYKKIASFIENDHSIFKPLLEEALSRVNKNIAVQDANFALSHGDFVPWNIIWSGKNAFIFDWEMCNFSAPAGIDLIHFLFMNGLLVRKIRGKKLFSYVMKEGELFLNRISLSSGIKMFAHSELFILYLLNMVEMEDKYQPFHPEASQRRDALRLLLSQR